MSSLIPLQFESHPIRIIRDDDGTPWFNANDVCAALGYSNPHKAVADHVDEDDLTKREVIDSLGRSQQMNYINESGLYSLILSSKKPEAKRFKKWVTSDVLPSIRENGRYHVEPALVSGDRPAKVFPEYFRIAKLIGLDKNAAAISANQATFKKTGENVLALMGIEHLETEQPWFTPTELGQRIDVTGRRFNMLLLEGGLQTKEGDHWLPTDSAKGMYRFFDTGKRHGDGTAVQQLKWSGDVLGKINREAA